MLTFSRSFSTHAEILRKDSKFLCLDACMDRNSEIKVDKTVYMCIRKHVFVFTDMLHTSEDCCMQWRRGDLRTMQDKLELAVGKQSVPHWIVLPLECFLGAFNRVVMDVHLAFMDVKLFSCFWWQEVSFICQDPEIWSYLCFKFLLSSQPWEMSCG